MTEISLNKAEQTLAIHLALERTSNARDKGIEDRKMGSQPGWITDLDGIGGEIAACKHFNVYPDTMITTDLPAYDFISRTGKKVDVKTTRYSNGKLLATLKKKLGDCDIYVLIVGEFPNYRFAGWALETELLDEKNIGDLGHGRGYILPQEKLRK